MLIDYTVNNVKVTNSGGEYHPQTTVSSYFLLASVEQTQQNYLYCSLSAKLKTTVSLSSRQE